nr:bifunctional diguanylate cyclase/phosphodiesterase [Paenibacillus turpanensis]
MLKERGSYLKTAIEAAIKTQFPSVEGITLHTGSAVLTHIADKPLELIVYTAIKEAIRQAKQKAVEAEEDGKKSEFLEILSNQLLSSVYQPIISLTDGNVFGYEALTRGPIGSSFHSPLPLFEFAEQEGYLYSLDKVTREKAVEGLRGLKNGQRVFINLMAQIINDPDFNPGQTRKLLKQYGLTPNHVVFEITERYSVEDFKTVKKVLSHYRAQGYQIAIDDAGAGYSSLQAIAELQPDYIKVDRSLIQGIHEDKVKEYILETFISFGRKMNVKIVAEGIETVEELHKLMRMGIHYGQGYLLGRPNKELHIPTEEITREIVRQREMLDSVVSLLTIGDLATPVKTFLTSDPSSKVANYFKANEEEQGVVIVNEQGVPAGLMMRDKLFQQLAGQYGISLYWNKEIRLLMDSEALIVEHRLSPEIVSQMAMARDIRRLYDFVIVVKDQKMVGAASVRTILESITQVRMEHARVSNPLTGLPGNIQIQRYIRNCISQGGRFSVIYIDLDYFKWFNDRYGFHKGDEVIQYTADILQQTLSACGNPHDFVGHIGGDDFIVISTTNEPSLLSEEIIRRFSQGVSILYEEEQEEIVRDRYGNQVVGASLSLSLAVVVCTEDAAVTSEGISRMAAELKKQAKEQQGNSMAITYFNEMKTSV